MTEQKITLLNGSTINFKPSDEVFDDMAFAREPGRILFEIVYVNPSPKRWEDRYEIESTYHDGAAFWLAEGMGIEYWVNRALDLAEPGWYVVEDLTVTWIRGDGYTTDDDEEWDFGIVRRATSEEIENEGLS